MFECEPETSLVNPGTGPDHVVGTRERLLFGHVSEKHMIAKWIWVNCNEVRPAFEEMKFFYCESSLRKRELRTWCYCKWGKLCLVQEKLKVSLQWVIFGALLVKTEISTLSVYCLVFYCSLVIALNIYLWRSSDVMLQILQVLVQCQPVTNRYNVWYF